MRCSHLALTLSPASRDLIQGEMSRWHQYLRVSDVYMFVNTSVTRPGVNVPTFMGQGSTLTVGGIWVWERGPSVSPKIWNGGGVKSRFCIHTRVKARIPCARALALEALRR